MGKQVAARLKWGCSSVGRAPALQAGGHEFESHHLHESNEESAREVFANSEHNSNYLICTLKTEY